MTRMRGALDGKSSVGKGTRICVYWPLASADTPAAEMPDVAGASGQGETVMVVDDEPELVSLTGRGARYAGIRASGIHRVSCGAQGISRAAAAVRCAQ